jgi:hypothetical protein
MRLSGKSSAVPRTKVVQSKNAIASGLKKEPMATFDFRKGFRLVPILSGRFANGTIAKELLLEGYATTDLGTNGSSNALN